MVPVVAWPWFRGLPGFYCSAVVAVGYLSRWTRSQAGAATPLPCPSPCPALYPGTALSPGCGVKPRPACHTIHNARVDARCSVGREHSQMHLLQHWGVCCGCLAPVLLPVASVSVCGWLPLQRWWPLLVMFSCPVSCPLCRLLRRPVSGCSACRDS